MVAMPLERTLERYDGAFRTDALISESMCVLGDRRLECTGVFGGTPRGGLIQPQPLVFHVSTRRLCRKSQRLERVSAREIVHVTLRRVMARDLPRGFRTRRRS